MDAEPYQLTVLNETGTLAQRQVLADAIMEGKPVMYRVGVSHGNLYAPKGESINPFGVSITRCHFKYVENDGTIIKGDEVEGK